MTSHCWYVRSGSWVGNTGYHSPAQAFLPSVISCPAPRLITLAATERKPRRTVLTALGPLCFGLGCCFLLCHLPPKPSSVTPSSVSSPPLWPLKYTCCPAPCSKSLLRFSFANTVLLLNMCLISPDVKNFLGDRVGPYIYFKLPMLLTQCIHVAVQ